MPISRRSLLALAGTGIASLPIAGATGMPMSAPTSSDPGGDIADLIKLSADSNAALMRGDIDAYLDLIALTRDFTLMAPFGGPSTHASQLTDERMRAMGRFFKNGTLEQEVVQSYASADMVVLAIIERAHVEVGGLQAQEWALRVTLVYRREGSRWRLAHRHADPLVHGISLTEAAALAKGKAP